MASDAEPGSREKKTSTQDRSKGTKRIRGGESCAVQREGDYRLVVTKLWVNGSASEDRDEWTEEVRASCERCYDDKAEAPEVQAERIRRQRISGHRRVALQWRRVTITVDMVLQARGKMPRNMANGPADCLVTEMLQCLPTKTVHEVACWFDERLKGECKPQRRGKFYACCSSRS